MESLSKTWKQIDQNHHEITQDELDSLDEKQVLELGNKFVEELEFDKAKVIFEHALKRFGETEDVLIGYGYFAFNIKDVERAKNLLLKSVAQNPSSNPKKYFHLGQLHSGQEALYYYTKGIEIIHEAINNTPHESIDQETKKDIETDMSQAYSAIAELYQTDLSMEPNAEENCKNALEKALAIDPNCMDAFFQLAQYHLNKDDIESARARLKKIVDYYRDQEKKGDEQEDYTEEFMLDVTRTLIEIEEFEDSAYMASLLLSDDEKNNEVLYLMIFSLWKTQRYDQIQQYLNLIQRDELKEDPELAEGLKELEAELAPILAKLPRPPTKEETKGGMDIEEEWEDFDEEDGEEEEQNGNDNNNMS